MIHVNDHHPPGKMYPKQWDPHCLPSSPNINLMANLTASDSGMLNINAGQVWKLARVQQIIASHHRNMQLLHTVLEVEAFLDKEMRYPIPRVIPCLILLSMLSALCCNPCLVILLSTLYHALSCYPRDSHAIPRAIPSDILFQLRLSKCTSQNLDYDIKSNHRQWCVSSNYEWVP